jgi:hypothetical protein
LDILLKDTSPPTSTLNKIMEDVSPIYQAQWF